MSLVKNNILLILSILFIIIIHVIMYDNFGYYVDEIGTMYDAYCISNFGVDRWLQSYPIHFMNYGDGQSAIFVYILVVLFKLFGYSKFVIRLVPLFFSIIGLIYTSKIAGLKNNRFKNIVIITYVALPITTLLFQFGLESHFMFSLSAMFIYYLLKGIETKRNKYYLISGVVCGITLYTYVLSYIIIPIFLVLYTIYLIKNKKVTLKNIIIFTLPVLLFGIPLLIVQIINIFDLNQITVLGITFPKFIKWRIGDLSFDNMFSNIYYTFINTNFYESSANTNIKLFGNIYYICIPLLLIGFVYHIKRFKSSNISAFIILWTLSVYLMAALLKDETMLTNTKLNALYLSKIFYISSGYLFLVDNLNNKFKIIKNIITVCLLVITVFFYSYYLTEYDVESKTSLIREDYSDIPEINKTIYVPDNYVYLLWSKKVNPYDFDIIKNGYREYNNYRVGYGNVIDFNSCYLVYKNDYVSQDSLESLSFKYLQLENYRLYYK